MGALGNTFTPGEGVNHREVDMSPELTSEFHRIIPVRVGEQCHTQVSSHRRDLDSLVRPMYLIVPCCPLGLLASSCDPTGAVPSWSVWARSLRAVVRQRNQSEFAQR